VFPWFCCYHTRSRGSCTSFSETLSLLLCYRAGSWSRTAGTSWESFQEPFSSWIFIFIRASSPHHTPVLIPFNSEWMCKTGAGRGDMMGMRLRERWNIEWVTELERTGRAWTRLWRTHWSNSSASAMCPLNWHCLTKKKIKDISKIYIHNFLCLLFVFPCFYFCLLFYWLSIKSSNHIWETWLEVNST